MAGWSRSRADSGSEDIADRCVIVAAGVQGNVENLGLEALGVKLDRGCIAADGYGRTNCLASTRSATSRGPMLAHKAEHEGVVCVEKICGTPTASASQGMIPGCTYSRPQIASVGLTEATARAAGLELSVGRFPFAGEWQGDRARRRPRDGQDVFDAATGKLLAPTWLARKSPNLFRAS